MPHLSPYDRTNNCLDTPIILIVALTSSPLLPETCKIFVKCDFKKQVYENI